jgi:hypothetical protein
VCARVVTTVEAHESVIGVGAKKANLELCPRLLFGLGLGLGLLLGLCLGLGLLLGLCLGPGLGPGRLDRRSGFGLDIAGIAGTTIVACLVRQVVVISGVVLRCAAVCMSRCEKNGGKNAWWTKVVAITRMGTSQQTTITWVRGGQVVFSQWRWRGRGHCVARQRGHCGKLVWVRGQVGLHGRRGHGSS